MIAASGLSKVCYASCKDILTRDEGLVLSTVGVLSDPIMREIAAAVNDARPREQHRDQAQVQEVVRHLVHHAADRSTPRSTELHSCHRDNLVPRWDEIDTTSQVEPACFW